MIVLHLPILLLLSVMNTDKVLHWMPTCIQTDATDNNMANFNTINPSKYALVSSAVVVLFRILIQFFETRAPRCSGNVTEPNQTVSMSVQGEDILYIQLNFTSQHVRIS